MEFFVWMAIPTLVVWILACHAFFANHKNHKAKHLVRYSLSLPLIGSSVILVGTVFGYDFFHVSVGPLPLTLDRALMGVWACIFGLQYLRQRESIRALDRSEWIILFLYGFLCVSLLTHDWQYKEKAPLSRMIFFYGLPLIAYLLIRSIRLNKDFLVANAILFAVLAIYLGITGIAEKQDWAWMVYPTYLMEPGEFFGRARGPLLNPVINGMLMALGCSCLWMGWNDGNRWLKAAIVTGSVIIAIGIFCTMTRSVWMGFLATSALFIWYPASQKVKSIILILAVIISVGAFPLVGDRLFSFKRDKEVSVEDMEMSARLRPIFATVAWNMFQDRPLLGCGFGQYSREKWPYLSDPHSELPLILAKDYLQHNVFLAYLTELGLVGLGLMLAALIMIGLSGWRLWSNQSLDLIHRLYGLALISFVLNYVINGMFHDVSIIPQTNLILLFLFGIVNNLNHAAKTAHHTQTMPCSSEAYHQIPALQ